MQSHNFHPVQKQNIKNPNKNDNKISQRKIVKYLGLHLDTKMH